MTGEGVEEIGLDATAAQCVECGHPFVVWHYADADPFTFQCPQCGSRDSLPTGFEASLLQDPEDWTDEELAIIY